MTTAFFIATFNADGTLTLLQQQFNTYPEAEAAIADLPPGRYQVQKVFVKE